MQCYQLSQHHWALNESLYVVIVKSVPAVAVCPDLLTAVSREAWATLPESSGQPLPATLAQTRNLAHASLETAVDPADLYFANINF